jgi:hypothetical protein
MNSVVLFDVTRETKLRYRVSDVPIRPHESITPRAENMFPLRRICVDEMMTFWMYSETRMLIPVPVWLRAPVRAPVYSARAHCACS